MTTNEADEKLIDAASNYAASYCYSDDPREFIQTDVMNAFYAGAAFARNVEGVAIPDGWKLVPLELTDAMEGALADAEVSDGTAASMWKAAVLAAPDAVGVQDVGVLEQCAQWCEAQAKSDWYGKAAADMVRAFALIAAPAAPAPKGEVVVTRNTAGAIVAVTRQDEEGRILSVIAEAATQAPAAQADEREAFEAWRRSYEGDGFASSAAMRSAFRDGFNAAIAAAQQSATPAEPVRIEARVTANTPWMHILACEVANCQAMGWEVRKLYATPADAASEADKRDALAAAHEGDWHDMMSAYNRCPADLSHPDRMRWLAAEFRRLVSLRAIKQRERQQGAQSNG